MGFRNQTHKERERGRMEKKKSPNQTSALRGEADEDWAGLKNASTCSSSLPQQSLEQFCDLRQVSESEFYNMRKGEGEAGNT